MGIEKIEWNTVCCGGCFYAEIEAAGGFAAVYKDAHTGEYRVRTYGKDKMPTSDEVTMTANDFANWFAANI